MGTVAMWLLLGPVVSLLMVVTWTGLLMDAMFGSAVGIVVSAEGIDGG